MLEILIVEPEPQLARMLEPHATAAHLAITACSNLDCVKTGLSRYDLILLSQSLSDEERVELIHTLKKEYTKPIVVVAPEDEESLLPLFEAGAGGYIRADATPQDIIPALKGIHEGKPPFSEHIGTALVARMHELLELRRAAFNKALPQPAPDVKLSARELEILHLLSAGLSNQEIAVQLMIQVGTVKNHVHNILKKLDVSSRSEAAQYYMIMDPDGHNNSSNPMLETALPLSSPSYPA
jgi:two-component system, NarL family, nitrate/nitrite response regulator NarL